MIYRCTTLHAKCYGCGLRGHLRGQCGKTPVLVLKAVFEQYATQGWKTSERYTDPTWGFYGIKPETHYQADYAGKKEKELVYEDLIGMDHEAAVGTVKEYNAKVEDMVMSAELSD